MEIMRLVVTGAVGAGKSTFIRSISDIAEVDTDREATDEVALLKQKTTVAFDFGRFQSRSGARLHLYGTPGQARFDFMWEMLIREADAYILLVAVNRPEQLEDARQILGFMQQRSPVPMLIGLTHTDCVAAGKPEDVAIALGYSPNRERPAMSAVDPHNAASVEAAIDRLVQSIGRMTDIGSANSQS